MQKIILGSKSPGRRKIITEMGYSFTVADPDIDEKSIRLADPKKLVVALAIAKAEALLSKLNGPALLITADQVVTCNGQIFEKPRNQEEARTFMQKYAKYPATTVTAVAVTDVQTGNRLVDCDLATIWFSKLTPLAINEIVAKESFLECAGGFSIESPLISKHIAKIEGAKDSIIGLPKLLTANLLRAVKNL